MVSHTLYNGQRTSNFNKIASSIAEDKMGDDKWITIAFDKEDHMLEVVSTCTRDFAGYLLPYY